MTVSSVLIVQRGEVNETHNHQTVNSVTLVQFQVVTIAECLTFDRQYNWRKLMTVSTITRVSDLLFETRFDSLLQW